MNVRYRAAAVVFSASFAAAAALPARAQEPVTAFEHLAVIPMDRERVLADQTVVVRGDRIVALGPAATTAVPREAVRVDGRGKFLMPGLGDMHAHVPGLQTSVRMLLGGNPATEGIAEAERMLFLYAANGVTTVRVMYGWPDDGTLRLRARAATGELLSPRIYAATLPVGGTFFPATLDVPSAKAAGYDFLKAYGLAGAELDSLAAAAHRAGLRIAGHAPIGGTATGTLPGTELDQVVRVGYASLEHLTGFAAYLTGDPSDTWTNSAGQAWPVDTAKLKAIAAAMRRAGVWNCPTVLLNESRAGADAWPELRYAMISSREHWPRQSGEYSRPDGALGVARRREVVRALRDAGAGLLLGTDAGVPYLVPGFSAHRELEALVRAGLTPYEALATGTRSVAAFLGTLDSTGTIAVGKRADLVLVTDNPLEDIRHTAAIVGVMLNGRWLARAELDARLQALEGTLP